MNPYRKVTDEEYYEIRTTWGNTDASFWHACDDDGYPRERAHNCYRRGVVYRNGNDLYFLAKGGPYVLPKSEYRFIEGDVNVNLSYMSIEMRRMYFGASRYDGGIRAYATKLGCNPSEIDGAPTFPEFLDIHATSETISPEIKVNCVDPCENEPKPTSVEPINQAEDDFVTDDVASSEIEVKTHVEMPVSGLSEPEIAPDAPTIACEPTNDAREHEIALREPKIGNLDLLVATLVTILAFVAHCIDLWLGSDSHGTENGIECDQNAIQGPAEAMTEHDDTICGMSDSYIALLIAEGSRNVRNDTESDYGFKLAA